METVEELKEQLRLYETDASKIGFFVLNKIVNQQIDYLKTINVKTLISSEENKLEYKNASDLWGKLPKMISELNSLRMELDIDGKDNENDIPKIIPVSPQMIAKTMQR